MKKLLNFFLSLLTLDFIASFSITAFIGSFFGTALGITPFTGFAILTAVLALAGFASPGITANAPFRMGLAKQIWISQLLENFYNEFGHLMRSRDMTAFVNYNTINLQEIGADPEVLIDNSSYPIDTEERTDNPLTLTLKRFRTKNTVIRDAEAKELAYNKVESVIRQHRSALRDATVLYGTWSWSPSGNTTETPVFGTTGSNDTSTSRKKMKIADIISARTLFDAQNVPMEGRVLVLNPIHHGHILEEDAGLQKQFANIARGQVLNLYGFDIYISNATAKYHKTNLTKNAYGAAVDATNDSVSSLFYHEGEVMRADGDAEMFARLEDPEADGDLIGFAKRFIALPLRNKWQGAIVSAPSA